MVDLLPDDTPLQLLFERARLPRFDLPDALTSAYGGGLGFETPRVIANFVSSLDGVVAVPSDQESGHIISGGNRADHFVMGLLRAVADVVLVGAGTFRKASRFVWDAASIYPPGARLFAEARALLGLAPRPTAVVVTASGAIDPSAPALAGGVIVTTKAGAAALGGVASTTRVIVMEGSSIQLSDLLDRLKREGARVVLTEGGPAVLAELVRARALDELFVTTSPALFGRFPNDHRKSLADGRDLSGAPLELLSVRRHGSYLFSRYALPGHG